MNPLSDQLQVIGSGLDSQSAPRRSRLARTGAPKTALQRRLGKGYPTPPPASRRACGSPLVLPEPLEPIRRQRRVAHCRGNRAVAEVVLDRPRVLAIVGQLITARMA
jgi:hypothetical protein